MEHYMKGEVLEGEFDVADLFNKQIKDDAVAMTVKNGSKIRNLIGFVVKKFKEDVTRQITFSGTGPAVSKTITCAEITKRKFKNLHQITKVFRKQIEEYWEPTVEGLDRLIVTRSVPGICILLSKDPLDVSQCGYQAPGVYDALWTTSATNEKKQRKQSGKNRKRQFHEKQKFTHKNEDKFISVKKDQRSKSSTSSTGIGTVQKSRNKIGTVQKSRNKDEVKTNPLEKEGKSSELKNKSENKLDISQKVVESNVPNQNVERTEEPRESREPNVKKD